MLNYGIIRKTVRDSLPAVTAALVGLVAFVILFVWAMLTMGTELLNFVSQFPLLQRMFEMSLGIRVDGEVSVNILFAVCFTHMIVFMLAWSVIIAATTRVTVGEVERGTADLMLTLPVSRGEVFVSTSLVWLVAAVLVSFAPIIGIWIGTLVFETDEVVYLSRFVAPATNFFCLNIAIGGMSTLAGCLLDRRGVAISVVIAIVFVSLVINFVVPIVEPFVDTLSKVKFLSLLNYYRPVDVVRNDEWPMWHMIILLAIGLVSWSVGLVIYQRKDVPTS